jgi:hypothetical protein
MGENPVTVKAESRYPMRMLSFNFFQPLSTCYNVRYVQMFILFLSCYTLHTAINRCLSLDPFKSSIFDLLITNHDV